MSIRTDIRQGKSDSQVPDDSQSNRWTLGQSEIAEIVAIDKIDTPSILQLRNSDCNNILKIYGNLIER